LRTRAFVICILLVLAIVSTTFIGSTQGVAGNGEWITSYKVEDTKTGQLMLEVDFKGENRTLSPIFPGAELKVTITISIDVTNPDTLLNLRTSMPKSLIKDVYWELISQNYPLIGYNPSDQRVQFTQTKGELVIALYGRIPPDVTTGAPIDYLAVTLYGPSGETLDNIRLTVVTAEMGEFQTILTQKEDKLQSLKNSGVAPGYVELFENVINEAKNQAALGNVDSAVAFLNTLSVSDEPGGRPVLEGLFFPAVGILIAVAAVLAFMFIRGRGKMQYILLTIEDQIKDLEGLTLRASKVDRSISSSLESVKERLKSITGM
jgi:hypothetical protein